MLLQDLMKHFILPIFKSRIPLQKFQKQLDILFRRLGASRPTKGWVKKCMEFSLPNLYLWNVSLAVIPVTTLEVYSTLPGGELLKYNKWSDFLFLKSLYQFLSIVIFVTDKLLVNDWDTDFKMIMDRNSTGIKKNIERILWTEN